MSKQDIAIHAISLHLESQPDIEKEVLYRMLVDDMEAFRMLRLNVPTAIKRYNASYDRHIKQMATAQYYKEYACECGDYERGVK